MCHFYPIPKKKGGHISQGTRNLRVLWCSATAVQQAAGSLLMVPQTVRERLAFISRGV